MAVCLYCVNAWCSLRNSFALLSLTDWGPDSKPTKSGFGAATCKIHNFEEVVFAKKIADQEPSWFEQKSLQLLICSS